MERQTLKDQTSRTEEAGLAEEAWLPKQEPFYEPLGNETALFENAWRNQLAVLLKGPTGCGKTRFMEHMAWRLKKPLITVSCHDDLTAADLVGRYLLRDGETVWLDGPLTRAVRQGCLCYLDEVVEARKDTTVVIHPLCDDRRMLSLEKLGQIVHARQGFCLVISYNPGYQSVLKDLKPSTRQRFVAIDFGYPKAEVERAIVRHETRVDEKTAGQLVKLAELTRNLKGQGLDEGASTRLLVHAGKLIQAGIEPAEAARACISQALSDDPTLLKTLDELSSSVF